MANDDTASTEPRPCQACRGTGRVVSNLGGEPHDLPCPWCDGSGEFLPEHDAQAAHPQGAESAPPAA